MAKIKVSANQGSHKNINIVLNNIGELELTGTNKKDKNFQQTLPVHPPCVLFWDNKIDNFVAFKIDGNVPDHYELIDVILDIKES